MDSLPRLSRAYTKPYNPVQHRRYLQRHAGHGACRLCRAPGDRIPLLGDSVVQRPMICPRCQRVWIYWVDISLVVRRRRAFCLFPSRQPFLLSLFPRASA